jgi:hypothetical protein
LLLTYMAPHFVDLCGGLYPPNAYCHDTGISAVEQRSIYRREGPPSFFNS